MRGFRKFHLASECRHEEKPIYSWTLTAAITNDSPRFSTMLKRVRGRIGSVCGDKAYSCRGKARRVASCGGPRTWF